MIECGDSVLGIVRLQIEQERALRGRQDVAVERGCLVPGAESVEECRRPQVLVDVEGRHASAKEPEATSAASGSRSGSGSPSPTNGTTPRTRARI